MARVPRPRDFEGATYHVFNRGVARMLTAIDTADYQRTLHFLGKMIARFELRCHAWCYMPNHYHLLLTSQLGNLPDAMQWLGTCVAQSFNECHERSGHVYKGRFESRLVADDPYFLELARYIPLNPVRAGLTATPEDWQWSSYAATANLSPSPSFLASERLLSILGSPKAYIRWVADGVTVNPLDEWGAPKKPSLASILRSLTDAAIAAAHLEHGYTKAAIAQALGVSPGKLAWRMRGTSGW